MKWQAGAQAIGQAVTWLSTLVVIRLLSSEAYGLMAMAGVLTSFFLLVADMGIGAATVQASTVSEEDLRQLGGLALLTNSAGFLLAVPSAALVAAYFQEPRLTEIVVAQSVSFLLMALYMLPQAQLVRAMNFRTKARVDTVAMIVSALTAVGSAALGAGVWSLVAASLLLHVTRAVGYRRATPTALSPRFSWTAARRFLAFGAILTVDRLLFFAFSQADVIIGGRVLGPEMLGMYTIAMSLAVIPLDKVIPVINQVSFSAYSRIQAETERVRRNVKLTVRLVALGAFPAFFGLSALAGSLVPAILGDKWLPIVVPMQLLSLMLPLKAVASVLPPALYGTGQPGVGVINLVISLIVLVVALLLGVPYGIVGLSLAWVCAYPIIFLITTTRTARALSIRPSEVFGECVFPFIAAAVMGAAVLALEASLPTAWGPMVRFLIGVLTCAATYGALVLTFKRSLIQEAMGLLRR